MNWSLLWRINAAVALFDLYVILASKEAPLWYVWLAVGAIAANLCAAVWGFHFAKREEQNG